MIKLPGKRSKFDKKWIKQKLANSKIEFFKNGVSQGVAFENVRAGNYHPAVSLYMDASVTFNFGPGFAHEPPSGDQYGDVMGVWEAPETVRVKRRSLRESKPVTPYGDMFLDTALLYAPGMGPFKQTGENVQEVDDDAGQAFPAAPEQTKPPPGANLEKTRWGSKYCELKWTNEKAPAWLPVERGWMFSRVKRATGLEMVRTERYFLTPEGNVCTTAREAREGIRKEEGCIGAQNGDRFSNATEKSYKKYAGVQRPKLEKFTKSPLQNKIARIKDDDDTTPWLVYNHISSQRKCVLIPLVRSGTFTVKRRKGRPRYKVEVDLSKQRTVQEDDIQVIKSETTVKAIDINREAWDINTATAD
uniref:SPRY domain-containing protein n=2 Tax=Amorphochlora amoebiformis TaxID=1561963 RepID=A0A7S0CW44_9EUKA|mmetsp:Transcript_14839/g.23458  ORF Transcript_14839/g.23458 Transcript_14839/m.23458 type:complete len:360 (+) Transcript_14839:916-1995(+)